VDILPCGISPSESFSTRRRVGGGDLGSHILRVSKAGVPYTFLSEKVVCVAAHVHDDAVNVCAYIELSRWKSMCYISFFRNG